MFTASTPPRRLNRTAPGPTRESSLPTGILLGNQKDGGVIERSRDAAYWNPQQMANPHGCVIGGSGAGKTQTLKGIAYSIRKELECPVVLVDFHGDQDIEGEVCYSINMESPHGINPMVINLDRQGGGPNLKAIELAVLLRKTLGMGPNQEGLLIELLKECYERRRITQERPITWQLEPPNFGDVQDVIEERSETDKEAQKLRLKMAALFEYGIFSKPQPVNQPHTRWDLSKLPHELQSIAGDSLASQLMNDARLLGDSQGQLRYFLFVDEAKELGHSKALDRIAADGRKYGLGLWVASQSSRHISKDVLGNTFTKIVLPVDSSELSLVSRTFRFSQDAVGALNPLEALVRFGKEAVKVNILPYWRRLEC